MTINKNILQSPSAAVIVRTMNDKQAQIKELTLTKENNSDRKSNQSTSIDKKHVKFSIVEIREYEMIYGKQCMSTEGNPQLLLDWDFKTLPLHELESFEGGREGGRRYKNELWLSPLERAHTLGMTTKKKKLSLVSRMIKKHIIDKKSKTAAPSNQQ